MLAAKINKYLVGNLPGNFCASARRTVAFHLDRQGQSESERRRGSPPQYYTKSALTYGLLIYTAQRALTISGKQLPNHTWSHILEVSS